jgi:hypothetical protein
MSHWVALPLGQIDRLLEVGWNQRSLPKEEWIRQTADQIEKIGNMNETKQGFLLLKEEPDSNQNVSAIVVPRSIDWALRDTIENCQAIIDAAPTLGPAALLELRETVYRDVRTDLIMEARSKAVASVKLTLEGVGILVDQAKLDRPDILHGLDASLLKDDFTPGDTETLRQLFLTAIEQATAHHLSAFQLFVENRLGMILGDHPALLAFQALSAAKQETARRWVINEMNWERFYNG